MRNALSLSMVLLALSWSASALAGTPGEAARTPPIAAGAPAAGVSANETGDRDAGAITDVDVVLVSGQYTGPGLWKVSKGGNTLWILGTVSPVPKGMDWYSPQAERVLAQAQEIIGGPGFWISGSAGGMFKMAFAMPTMLRARKNPDEKTLRDVLPADLYARWVALKPVYLGNDKSVEQLRPVFAAGELYQAAIKRSGLVSDTGVRKRLREIQKVHKTKYTPAAITTDIKDPKKLAKSFARAELDDVQCFRSVLDRLELDVANAAERANAWAAGDIPELTRLFHRGDVMMPCLEAMAKTEAARSMGMDDGFQRSEALWLKIVESALAANHTSFATLPVDELLEADGLLARLQAKGYVVVVPE